MRRLARAALAAALLVEAFTPATARYRHHHAHHHVLRHHFAHAQSHGGGYYTAASGHRVHGPVRANARPLGATAHCRDGSWSFSESHRGTCSWHGGVASWL